MMEQPEDSLLLSYLECYIYQKDRGQCLEMNIVSPFFTLPPKATGLCDILFPQMLPLCRDVMFAR